MSSWFSFLRAAPAAPAGNSTSNGNGNGNSNGNSGSNNSVNSTANANGSSDNNNGNSGNGNASPAGNDNASCVDRPTFDLCYQNWLGGGTVAICASQVQGSKEYNQCLCQEYYSEWYCYTAFCPSDNTISQLQSYYTTYCKMVPDFNPTNQFSPLGTVIGVVKASASAAPGATAANGQPVLAVPSAVGGASGAGVGGAASPSAAPLTALPQPPSQQSGAFSNGVGTQGIVALYVAVGVAVWNALF